jgi:hypothetical protein
MPPAPALPFYGFPVDRRRIALFGLGLTLLPAYSAAAQSPPAIVPGLRGVDELAAPEGQTDSGMGVYPALSPPARLVFPPGEAVAEARKYAGGRRGTVAFAVADGRGGVTGLNVDRPFRSASLTKAMLLVAYLRRNAELSEADRLSLGYMIRISDNGSADTIYGRVGDALLRDVARRAGMTRFAIDGDWANATVTAADQARFFLALDRLLPPRHRALARNLLETVWREHTWGIPDASRPRWRTFFKGGWRPGGEGEVVHQGALLERRGRRVGVAVMSDGNPAMRYGEQSIEGVTRRLLATSTASVPRGSLAPITSLAEARARPPRMLMPLPDASRGK